MTKARKTLTSVLHRGLINDFVADFRDEHWVAVADLSLARKLRSRELRQPYLTAKLTRDLVGDAKVRVLAAVWDGLGNIFALLPNGTRKQFIGR